MKLLVLDTMRRFQCNQKGCCCKTWTIDFDADEALLLADALHPDDAKRMFTNSRVGVTDDGVLRTIAPGTVGEDKRCCFLAGDGRCGVHAVGLFSRLPSLCKAFPAVAWGRDDGGLELHYDAVCPEVLTQLEAEEGPLIVEEVEAGTDADLDARTGIVYKPPPIRIAGRSVTHAELQEIRVALIGTFNERYAPALDVLADVSHALAEFGAGEPLTFGPDPDARPRDTFDAFFETCVEAHHARPLASWFVRYRRFVHDGDLPEGSWEGLEEHLDYRADWRERVDPRDPAFDTLLSRFLAHRFFNAYRAERSGNQLFFTYGGITHTLASAFRYAEAVGRWLDRPVDRALLKVCLGSAEHFMRNVNLGASGMPWFRAPEAVEEKK